MLISQFHFFFFFCPVYWNSKGIGLSTAVHPTISYSREVEISLRYIRFNVVGVVSNLVVFNHSW